MSRVMMRRPGIYEKYFKRPVDFVLALCALIIFSPLLMVIAVLVKEKLGSPVIFTQLRPGLIEINGKEKIFKLYKFKTMTDARDSSGNLLLDAERLTSFGMWLRSTSMDELPELWNIIRGDMSLIGPRPQLVFDMVFMNDEQRRRHSVKPGLSGLAQINGRNSITWEEKFKYDLIYIENITFYQDLKILFKTLYKTIGKNPEGITDGENATADDFGKVLLKKQEIDINTYNQKKLWANRIINEYYHDKMQ